MARERQSNWIHLENCEVTAHTEKAIRVKYNEIEYWFPRSQVSDGDQYARGDKDVTISITEWICNENGVDLIED